ncbi:MAG: chromosome segregation protein SMC [Anaerolineales bacterium]|nr:chromosome segregation protein SMC [Anaerolineales bacterium]
MSHLKSLELHGYKTFASKTRFEFAEGITAIVGPNGSGKSNIADAIRWVLGEQAYTLLRGKKTEDMIFSGSEQRPRAGMASALIAFDNADGGLPIEFSEVTVGRSAYRDGSNEYFLNDARVRLKDIDELLARCGLSERTYTIIGQGLVDSALSLKPEERRRLFEEAAGIGLFRTRREESLRRLETTKRNLERVLDILAELQPRVESLRRQAKRASEYETVRGELKDVLLQWHGYHWRIAQEELGAARTTAETAEKALAALQEAQEQSDGRFASVRTTLGALRAQLNSWHRQASEQHRSRETLSRELAVNEERLRLLERSQAEAAAALTAAEAEAAALEERAAEHGRELERIQAEREEIRAQLERAESARQNLEAERRAQRERRTARQAELQELEAELMRSDARAAQCSLRRGELVQREEAVMESRRTAAAEAEAHAAKAAECEQSWERGKEALEAARSDQDRAQEAAGALKAAVEDARQAFSRKREEEIRLRARSDVLAQAEKELLGYGGGLRHLVGASQQGALRGVLGAFAAQLEVKAEHEAAIAAALGEFQDSVLLQETDSLEAALESLAAAAAGRTGLLALPVLIPPEPVPLPAASDLVGRASELVKASAALRPALDAVLGNVAVVRSRAAARSLAAGLPPQAKVVTLSGEVFHPAGPVVAGRGEGSSALSRSREIRELSHALRSAQEAAARVEAGLAESENKHREAVARAEECARLLAERQQAEQELRRLLEEAHKAQAAKTEELRWQEVRRQEIEGERTAVAEEETRLAAEMEALRAKIEAVRAECRAMAEAPEPEEAAEAGSDISHYQTRLALTGQALQGVEARRSDAQETLERARRAVEDRRGRTQSLREEQAALEEAIRGLREEETRLSDSIRETQQQIEPAEKQLAEAEAEQGALEESEAESRQRLHSAERQYTQAQVELARRQEELEGLRRRIEDDFGLVEFEYASEVTGPNPLPLADLVERLPHVPELTPEVEDLVNRRRSQVRRMGAINPEAIREYAEVKERFEFLNAQVQDLQKAETQLREVIAELDTMMREAFQRTFAAVAEEFPKIFVRLFGGGSAKLALTETADGVGEGIEITAKLPGKRSQGLALLSGGERSLTAVALVFSLLKVAPTPFCVLDEVDAMLDESNVGRFRELLLELSRQTQFVIVTHNRNTVQAAQVIYGVSMGSDSASQVISLKLDEFAAQAAE